MSDIDNELTDTEGTETQESKTHFADGFPKWTAALPSNLQKDERMKGFNTPGELALSYLGLQDKHNSLPQVPDKPDGYEFPAPDEGVEVDPNVDKWFRKTAHGLKLPKGATEKLYGEYNKMIAKRVKDTKDAGGKTAQKNEEMIRGEWGLEYDANLKLVEKGIAELGGDELEKLLTDTGLRNHPAILKAFKQIGFEHSDDTLRGGTIGGGKGEHTLDDEYPSMKELPDRR